MSFFSFLLHDLLLGCYTHVYFHTVERDSLPQALAVGESVGGLLSDHYSSTGGCGGCKEEKSPRVILKDQ